MEVRRRIELYLRRSRTAATRFGRDVAGDPRLVFDIRRGRQLGWPLAMKINEWLDRHEAELRP